MLANLKRKAVELARSGNIHLTGVTSRESLVTLLRMLKPMDTGHRLIRIGGASDGGYVIPDDMDGVTGCFSPGVSDIADFEMAMANRGIACFMADASVSAPPLAHPLFNFERKFIGRKDGGEDTTLETWINSKTTVGDLILQMDIEGAEYDALFSTPSNTLRRFRIMVIEFHDLDRLASPDYFSYVYLLIEKLTQDFVVCHIHPNNWKHPVNIRRVRVPPLVEISLLRRDRIKSLAPRSDFPHPLDRANIPDRPDLALPREWFS